VEATLESVVVCNCSICVKTAYLHWEIEPERFRLLTPFSAVRSYQFGTMTSRNYFCVECGISAFRISRSAPDMVDVNVRCLQGVDADSIPVVQFDGENWEKTMRKGSV
jgi:hypothetical protein